VVAENNRLRSLETWRVVLRAPDSGREISLFERATEFPCEQSDRGTVELIAVCQHERGLLGNRRELARVQLPQIDAEELEEDGGLGPVAPEHFSSTPLALPEKRSVSPKCMVSRGRWLAAVTGGGLVPGLPAVSGCQRQGRIPDAKHAFMHGARIGVRELTPRAIVEVGPVLGVLSRSASKDAEAVDGIHVPSPAAGVVHPPTDNERAALCQLFVSLSGCHLTGPQIWSVSSPS
jgi:hypothetical protein